MTTKCLTYEINKESYHKPNNEIWGVWFKLWNKVNKQVLKTKHVNLPLVAEEFQTSILLDRTVESALRTYEYN